MVRKEREKTFFFSGGFLRVITVGGQREMWWTTTPILDIYCKWRRAGHLGDRQTSPNTIKCAASRSMRRKKERKVNAISPFYKHLAAQYNIQVLAIMNGGTNAGQVDDFSSRASVLRAPKISLLLFFQALPTGRETNCISSWMTWAIMQEHFFFKFFIVLRNVIFHGGPQPLDCGFRGQHWSSTTCHRFNWIVMNDIF